MSQTFFHLVFVVTFVAFTLIRMYYHRKARTTAGKVTYIEGKTHTALRALFGIPYILLLFVYMFAPSILGFAVIPLPEWAQWIGAVLCAAVLPLIWWVQRALGSNFATTLHVRDEHTLVTAGPYRWVRHPMYTAFFIQAVGLLLLTRNWFIGGVYLLALTVIVVTRTANEERTMLDKFGEQYRIYMQRTGRFVPKL
jgi:protein-S-isoprenylcysteine O-methyltransferase Ste14